jgi:hypothetical protein
VQSITSKNNSEVKISCPTVSQHPRIISATKEEKYNENTIIYNELKETDTYFYNRYDNDHNQIPFVVSMVYISIDYENIFSN